MAAGRRRCGLPAAETSAVTTTSSPTAGARLIRHAERARPAGASREQPGPALVGDRVAGEHQPEQDERLSAHDGCLVDTRAREVVERRVRQPQHEHREHLEGQRRL